ncbi:MAG TPA: histidine kinase dimerization/phospho-acceptor domain-containing protein [Kofleriaceae bacterium]
MTEALAHAPLPIAVFRGPQLDCVTASEPWRRLFPRKAPAALLERLERTYRTQRTTNVTLQTAARTLRIVIRPVPNEELLATCIDCTELHRARAEAASARRFKERALSAVSHDLRGPISTILLWERILRDRSDESDARKRALDAIRESATTQSSLLAELVEIASVVAGVVGLANNRVPIESVLAGAIEATATAKRAAFTIDLEPPLGYARGDAARLHQALVKVIETAARIAPAGSAVPISARRIRSQTVIWVGKPVPGRRPERVNELELGLVLAGELIALHGGTLEALRHAPGQVPTFSISLPSVRSSRT